MAKTRQQSALTPKTVRKARIKPKPPQKPATVNANQNLHGVRKRKRHHKPRHKYNLRLSVNHLDNFVDHFVTNRTLSSMSNKDIQVTCTTTSTEPSSSHMADNLNKQAEEDNLNLSLASFGKKQIKKKLSFEKKFMSQHLDDDVISIDSICDDDECLDTVPESEVARTVPTDATLIVIDDDSVDCVIEESENIEEVIDLTTPQPTPVKPEKPNNASYIPLEAKNVHQIQPLFPPIPHIQQPCRFSPPPLLSPRRTFFPTDIFGTNFLNAGAVRTVGLRPIYIDGNNIAMG